MINKLFLKRSTLLSKCLYNYGDLIYTNELKVQTSFDKVPTFRAFDLDGKLINKSIKYNCD